MQLDDFTINCILLFYLKKKIDSTTLWVSKCSKDISGPLDSTLCPFFFYSFHILMLSVIYMYYCTDSLQHGIYFFKFIFF